MAIQKKKVGENKFRKSLNKTFNITDIFVRYRLYRPFRKSSPQTMRIVGFIAGGLLQLTMKGLKNQILQSFKMVFPHITQKRSIQLYKGMVGYVGQLLMDTVLRIPNASPENLSEFVKFENLDVLDNALAQNKGVILTSLHMAQFFYIFGIIYHPNHYPLAVIGNLQNVMLFKKILEQKQLSNFWVIGARKLEDIRPKITEHLRQNHCVFLMHDMGKGNHLRTPFLGKKYPFLWRTPQSAIALHRNLGTPIIPVVSIPNGHLGSNRVIFLNPAPLEKIDKNFANPVEKNHKNYHGAMSTAISAMLNIYLMRYFHLWEEISNFWFWRAADNLRIPANITLKNFLELLKEKILDIIEKSWEPDRDDTQLINQIIITLENIEKTLNDSQRILWEKKKIIKLTGLSGIQEIKKLIIILCEVLLKNEEKNAMAVGKDMISNL